MDTHSDPQWVARRLATIEPSWTPDEARGRARLDDRLAAPRHWRMWWAAAAAAVLLAFVMTPRGSVLAQELWYRLLVSRVTVVRLDLSEVPLDTSITTDGLQVLVSNAREAAERAGFTPHLPSSDMLAGNPAVSVTGPLHVRQTIRRGDLAAALSRVGASDLDVPVEWDGVTLRATVGPMVIARYPGDIEIVQMAPIELNIPAGFPLARFAETAFRAGGLSWWEARTLGREFAARPAWLLDIPDDEVVTIEHVTLPTGSALLLEDVDDMGAIRVTVIVSRPTRIYAVSSPTRNESLRLAGVLP